MATATGTTTPVLSDSDLARVAKSVQFFDSSEKGEREAALARVFALLSRSKMSFSEAVESRAYKAVVWDAKGHPEWLKNYFETDKHRLENERLAMKVSHLTADLARSKSAAAMCPGCETKRRWLASIAGLPTFWLWLHSAAHSLPHSKALLYGLLLSISPVSYTWLRWRFIRWRHAKNVRNNHVG